jgi:cellulose synthase/poly-beta-1,6-N-acetylglucosamine synthase-like glycosyltransferase
MTHSVPVVLFLLVLYLYAIAAYLMLKARPSEAEPDPGWEPRVSIIVTAKNEGEPIPFYLESLENPDYPAGKLEFIFVDDHLEKGTGRWMKRFQKTNPNVRCIGISGRTDGGGGKNRGLAEAAKSATGEILFFIEEDCGVPKTWIRTLLESYATGVGLVAGFVLLDGRKGRFPLFARIQSLGRIHLTAVGAAWADLGYPLGVLGNNFSIRKAAFDQAGGFESVGRDRSEGIALLRNVRERTHWRAVWIADETGAMAARAATGLRDFFRRRKRWALGGMDHGWISVSLTAVAFLARFSVLACLFTVQWKLALLGFWILLLSDGLLLVRSLYALNRMDLAKYMVFYEIYSIGITLCLAPFVLFGKSFRREQINQG